ncbi:MAG: hypothetical protein OXG09_01310 [Chloroflexi bacterium]|nr:hypothetical protein [Chloroflexota bacterium]
MHLFDPPDDSFHTHCNINTPLSTLQATLNVLLKHASDIQTAQAELRRAARLQREYPDEA